MFEQSLEDSNLVKKGEELLQKYMQGKANLDKRIVENEQWYKMLHWEQIRAKDNGPQTASAWLFNSLANKHADVEGGGLKTIVKQLGSAGTADPLDQRASAGWKALKTAEILCDEYMVRIESSSSFSTVEAN